MNKPRTHLVHEPASHEAHPTETLEKHQADNERMRQALEDPANANVSFEELSKQLKIGRYRLYVFAKEHGLRGHRHHRPGSKSHEDWLRDIHEKTVAGLQDPANKQLTIEQLGAKIGVSFAAVRRAAAAIGFKIAGGTRLPIKDENKIANERIKSIISLVGRGFNLAQIATELNMGREQISSYAKAAGIKIGSNRLSGAIKVDQKESMLQTVMGVDALAASLRMDGVDMGGISKQDAVELVGILRPALTLLNKLLKTLKEKTNVIEG